MVSTEAPLPDGEVVMEFSLEMTCPIAEAAQGWTPEQVAALLAGDRDARGELIGMAAWKATGSDSVEPDHAAIYINGEELT